MADHALRLSILTGVKKIISRTCTLGLIAGLLNGSQGSPPREAGVKLDNSITVNGSQLVLNSAGAQANWRP